MPNLTNNPLKTEVCKVDVDRRKFENSFSQIGGFVKVCVVCFIYIYICHRDDLAILARKREEDQSLSSPAD